MSLTCCLILAAVIGQRPATDFSFDFRGGKPLPQELSLFGPDVEKYAEQELDGLRIRPPTAGKISSGWGVVLRFTFTGDFEITGGYEILTMERPTRGTGAGVALNALPSLGSRKLALLGRLRFVGDEQVFTAAATNKDEPGEGQWNSVPAATRAGRLRLKRTGTKLHYLVTDSLDSPFREIAAFEFGGEDLSMVRFVANNSGSPTVVDVRLVDLKASGTLIPQKTLEEIAGGLPLMLTVAGIAALVLIIVGVRWSRRRRTTAGGLPDTTPSGQEGQNEPRR